MERRIGPIDRESCAQDVKIVVLVIRVSRRSFF